MRVALIADIHGNLEALDAALEDIERTGVDETVCLGDVAATGPNPRETVERLMERGFPMVMGNADEDMFRTLRLSVGEANPDARRVSDIDRWCAGELSEKHIEYIRTFRKTVEVDVGGRKLLCFHGSPKSNTDVIVAETSEKELAAMLSGSVSGTGDFAAGGHTHSQMVRRHGSVTFVNPGSVGLPVDGEGDGAHNPPWAEYAVVAAEDGVSSVEMRRVAVDVERVKRAAIESGMPHSEWWASDWRG